MNKETGEYERHQLQLIAATYEKEGFDVQLEVRLSNIPFRFDAVAHDPISEKMVIIEVVNARLGDRSIEQRRRALEAVAKFYPSAKVDFRYIDHGVEPFWVRSREPGRRGDVDILQAALSRRLPRLSKKLLYDTIQFAELWTLHIAMLRAYGKCLNLDDANSIDVRDLYNELLRLQRLVPPEDNSDKVTENLFDLYDTALATMQGALALRYDVMQIRGHVISVRAQIRKWFKTTNMATRAR
ncbi:hypothetical protein ACS0ZG_31920 [Burkholderia gladioli]|uniref:hypothetical protein n=1 Tax=Burkholderia gladioli TaxID=28095 RepID=UPI003F791528